MSSLSTDRKPPLDYGVQIRFIKDLDDTGGGYADRSRGAGAVSGTGAPGTPPSNKYGVAVRVQGISGQPYVVLKDGEKGDSYGVQLKTQSQTQSQAPALSSTGNDLPQALRDGAQTPNPYGPVGQSALQEEETGEYGSPLRRPPGDGQAGSQGEMEVGTPERPTSTSPANGLEKKNFGELNEAGLRRVGQNHIGAAENGTGLNGPLNGKRAEAIDTKSLAPINKLISKFNNNSPSIATSSLPGQTRGRSGARTRLQFEDRKRSRSLDARKDQKEEPPSPPTVNPYAPTTTNTATTLNSPKPATYSSLGRNSSSIAKVPAVPASKPLTFNKSPKNFVAMETPPTIPKKPVSIRVDFLSIQAVLSGHGHSLTQVCIRSESIESEAALKRKAGLIHDRFSEVKVSTLAITKQFAFPSTEWNRATFVSICEGGSYIQDGNTSMAVLRMEKEGVESRLHQQEDHLAQLQEELRRVSENTTDSLQTDLMTIQAELSEAMMLRQKQDDTLRMRERELTALKGALKDEVASHDKEMEALREQYGQDMEALRQSLEHVSQSQQEIEEERQKVNSSILALEEELDSYREQSDHWKKQTSSNLQFKKEKIKQIQLYKMEMLMGDSRQSVQVLQSQLDDFKDRSRRELQDTQRLSKERLAELQRSQNNLKAAQEELSRLKKELMVASEERDSAQLDKDLLSSRLKHLESELDTERTSQTDRSREIRLLEVWVCKFPYEYLICFPFKMDQLRSELMQERSARHDLEMDKSSLERQIKDLKSRVADMEGLSRPSAGVTLLENKIQELEDRLRSEEREKTSILAAQRRVERKLKDVNATLDQERNQHAEQRDQLSLRVKALKRQVDESEGEVERLEGVRRKVLRELEEHQEVKEALQAKVGALENELKRKIQQTRRPALGSTLSSEDEDGYFDSSSITSILTESQLQTTNC
uniref:Cingulin b n=1 Tax=Astyanax mexicanus TaxID=7994 RepID=A0A8B9LWM1_ASTMX